MFARHPRIAFTLAMLAFQCSTQLAAQPDSLPVNESRTRYVLWVIPSTASHIHGIAFGPIGSEHICDREHPQVSNGLNVQFLGTGILVLIGMKVFRLDLLLDSLGQKGMAINLDSVLHFDDRSYRVTHNGVLISPLGTFTPRINGVSLNGLSSFHLRMNGLSVNGVWNLIMDQRGVAISLFNSSVRVHGMQIGLVNRTHELKGLQIGLWNRNSKRALPLMNWGGGG